MNHHRSSNVTVESAAARTAVHSFFERFCFDSSTFRARLGSSARVNSNQFATSLLSFVCEHLGQRGPRGVIDMLGKHSTRQALYVQILNCNSSEFRNYRRGKFVQIIASRIFDRRPQLSNIGATLPTNVRINAAPRYGALQSTHFFSIVFRKIVTGNRFPVAHRHQAIKTNVNSHAACRRAVRGADIDIKNDIPLPAIARQDRRRRFAWQAAVPSNLYFSRHADKAQPLSFLDDHKAIPDTEVGRMISTLCFKSWKAWSFAAFATRKKGLERLVELSHNLLLSGCGPATNMRQLATNDGQARYLLMGAYAHALAAAKYSMLQRCVIKLAKIGKHFGQKRRLRFVWFDAIAVAKNHWLPAMKAADKLTKDVRNCAACFFCEPLNRKMFISREPNIQGLFQILVHRRNVSRLALRVNVKSELSYKSATLRTIQLGFYRL